MNILRRYSPHIAVAVATLGLAMYSNAQESRIGDLTGHATAGAIAYKRSCIGCHGVRGNGMGDNAPFVEPKPRDFTAGAFKCRSTPTGSLPTDQDIYNSIKRGFNTTAMPSWESLTPQTRADLVAYVKTFSPRFAKEKPDPSIIIPAETPVTLDSIKRGNALFQKLECWKCHGPEGRGDGPSASTLTDSKDQPIRPYDFTSGTRFKCGQTNTDLYRIFMTGVDGTPMPSFSDNVTPDQAWDLVHYLRTLQVKRKSKENNLLKAAGGKNILVAAATADPVAAPVAPAATADPVAPAATDTTSTPAPAVSAPATDPSTTTSPATPPAEANPSAAPANLPTTSEPSKAPPSTAPASPKPTSPGSTETPAPSSTTSDPALPKNPNF